MRLTDTVTTTLKTVAALALIVPAAAACSDDATGPDGGTVSATVHDDPSSGSAAEGASFSRISAAESSDGSYSGEVEADVTVQVSADGSTWTDVAGEGSSQSQVVDLQVDSETTVASEASVEAGTYSHVRIVMESPSASLNGGGTITGSAGDVTLDADLTLDLGSDGQVVVEKEVADFEISADSNTTITTDLNSEAWITPNSVEAGAVSSSEIESATAVSIS